MFEVSNENRGNGTPWSAPTQLAHAVVLICAPPVFSWAQPARSTPGKKYPISKAAVSGASEPWTALRSMSVA